MSVTEATRERPQVDGPIIGIEADLSGCDLSGRDLSGRDLSRANLEGARLDGANLRGATLFEVKASGAEFLGADLTGAVLTRGDFTAAGFGGVDMTGADARGADFSRASLVDARLVDADCATATFEGARLNSADLTGADLQSAQCDHADLSDASVAGTNFRRSRLRCARLSGLRGYRRAQWIMCDVRDVDPYGVALLCDHIADENFIDEFRRQSARHEVLYKLWWLTSDCGRSSLRWGVCSTAIALLFAVFYTFVGVDFGPHESWVSPVYFSVITFSTLGYGDVLPITPAAQIVVIAEVMLGYTMLGGLLSLISGKLNRRGA